MKISKVKKYAFKALFVWQGVAVWLLTMFCIIGVSGSAVGAYVFGGPSGTWVVTLDSNGGTVSPSSLTFSTRGDDKPYGHYAITVFRGTLGDLPTPVYEGHVFQGWFTDANGGAQVGNGTQISSSSQSYYVTYHAHWRLNAYKVKFLPNGGTGSMSDQSFVYGEALSLARNGFVKAGYTFTGWKMQDGTFWEDGSSVSFVGKPDGETIEAVAQWSANPYKVAFNANGGTVSTSSKNVQYDAVYGVLPKPSRVGYSFAGWYTAASGGALVSETTKISTAANHSLYAHWTANACTVTFNANGGVVTTASKSVRYDGSYGPLPVPTREDCIFVGWFTAVGGGVEVTQETTVTKTSDHVLYAQWTPDLTNAYLVRLHRNYDGRNGDVIAERIFKIGQSKALPTISELGWAREGCRFLGWVVGSGKDVIACFDGQIVKDLSVTPGAIVSLYAGWR